MYPILNIAIRAARKAGNLIAKCYENPNYKVVTHENSDIDKSNDINQIIENVIINTIHKSYPKHLVFSKRGLRNNIDNNQDVLWIIDPLSGATNFIKSLPHFAVSIAISIKGRIEINVIYDPIRNELFTAIRGRGAQLNGYRLRVSHARNLSGTILACHFLLNSEDNFLIYTKILNQLLNKSVDFRRTGSTALDLAYVAAGRIDGYFKIDLESNYFITEYLIACEAGALICDFRGSHSYDCMIHNNIVIGNPRIVKAILDSIVCITK